MDWKSAIEKERGAIAIPRHWLFLHYYEALNILFRTENALRILVYIVLKEKYLLEWDRQTFYVSDGEQISIANAAAKRMSQAKSFGYLGYQISNPMMHLNSGELTRLIVSEAYWSLFKPYFKAKKDIIKNKLDEVGTVRNSLAHFRPIKHDDVEMIKQNMKHALVGVEEFLSEMIDTRQMVPSNTTENWYLSFKALRSDLCDINLFQSKNEKWYRIELTYRCDILKTERFTSNSRRYNVLSVVSSNIFKIMPHIAKYIIYLNEAIPHASYVDDGHKIFKKISFVLTKEMMLPFYEDFAEAVEKIIGIIDEESSLIKDDNLARGSLVETAKVLAQEKTIGEYSFSWWKIDDSELICSFNTNDPPEYWGDIGLDQDDFIATTDKFPWMPSSISNKTLPF